MGVDPQGFTFVRAHMPTLMHFDGGGFGANFNGDISALSDDAWNRCLRFVIETSLRFDANDFDIPERVGNGNTFLRRNAEESDLAIGDTPDRAS